MTAHGVSAADRKGYLMIGGVAACLVALFGARFYLGAVTRADADNCVGTPTSNTVVLLDRSEWASTQTLEEIRARTLAHVEARPANERVSVFEITDRSTGDLRPLFSRCRPKREGEGNRAIENTRQLKTKYEQSFLEPLRNAMDTVIVGSASSPIAQTVTDLTLSQYLRGEENHLLIFSDMLENTSGFSLRNRATMVDRIRQPSRQVLSLECESSPRL